LKEAGKSIVEWSSGQDIPVPVATVETHDSSISANSKGDQYNQTTSASEPVAENTQVVFAAQICWPHRNGQWKGEF
jgi:hypothetical protein